MSPVVQNVNDRLLYQVMVDPRRGGKRSLISSEIRSFSTRRYLIRTGSKPTDSGSTAA